jgi:hypothetical protein
MNQNLGAIAEELTKNKIGLAEIFSNATLITKDILKKIRECRHHPYFKKILVLMAVIIMIL